MKRLLQVCFIAAMVFGLASCNKDDANPTNNGNSAQTPTSLVGTEWTWNNGKIEFTTSTNAKVTVYNYNDSQRKVGYFDATYTYSNGNGTLWMYIDGRQIEVPFTISGNTMTASGTPDGDVTLTQVNNQQPEPDTPTSLAGTDWSYFDGEATVVVSFVSASSVEVHVSTPNGPESYYGSYTYSNGSGTMNLTVRSQEYQISFTVNGNTLIAYNTPSGDVTLTRDNNQQ